MTERHILGTPNAEIIDSDLKMLISELMEVTKVQPNLSQTLYDFLVQCVYPAGAGERFKIEKVRLTPGRFLLRKVSKLESISIYRLCDELAGQQNQTAEIALNMPLHIFLNKYLPDFEKKPKKPRFDPRDWR